MPFFYGNGLTWKFGLEHLLIKYEMYLYFRIPKGYSIGLAYA